MKKPVGRLALRHEGPMWNAYYTKPDSMEGGLLLGSIAMKFVAENPQRRSDFIAMMKTCLDDFFQDAFNERADWQEAIVAPDHERQP